VDITVIELHDPAEARSVLQVLRTLRQPTWKALTPLDLILGLSLAALVLAVHDVGYMLNHPFWLDEAWVADSVRARVGLTPFMSSSTPLGWTFLLRLVPFGGAERLRLVPLGFTMLLTSVAYLFGRELRITRYSTGLLMSAGVLLLPAILLRDDLKQYTAEAFVSVLLLLLTARAENQWTRGRLFAIAAVGSGGMLIANTASIVGGAILMSLALECAVKRKWRGLFDVVVAGLAFLAAAVPIYVLLDRPKMTGALTTYWDGYYLPSNPGHLISSLDAAISQLAPAAGFKLVPLDCLLIIGGIAALLKLGRTALAATLPIVLLTNIGASISRAYPFGDLRTSTYWIVMVPLLGSIAVVVCAKWLARVDQRLPVVAVLLAGSIWLAATDSSIRAHPLAGQDVRSQVAYVTAHYQPGDVIIVDLAASWGFAYYYHGAGPAFIHDPLVANGFVPTYPDASFIIIMRGRSESDLASALATARARQISGRIWFVTSNSQRRPGEVSSGIIDVKS
jgi:hypothetical protein